MSQEKLQNVFEMNHANIKALLDALGADYDMPADPVMDAKMAAVFGGKGDVAKAAELADMSDAERTGWFLETNTKAIAAAAEAAGASNVVRPGGAFADEESESAASLDDIARALGGR